MCRVLAPGNVHSYHVGQRSKMFTCASRRGQAQWRNMLNCNGVRPRQISASTLILLINLVTARIAGRQTAGKQMVNQLAQVERRRERIAVEITARCWAIGISHFRFPGEKHINQ